MLSRAWAGLARQKLVLEGPHRPPSPASLLKAAVLFSTQARQHPFMFSQSQSSCNLGRSTTRHCPTRGLRGRRGQENKEQFGAPLRKRRQLIASALSGIGMPMIGRC